MDFALIWLSFIIASVLATFVAFSLVVPSRIRKKPVDEREAAYKRARSWLVKAQLLWGAVVGMTGLAIGNHGLVLTGLIAFGWAPMSLFLSRIGHDQVTRHLRFLCTGLSSMCLMAQTVWVARRLSLDGVPCPSVTRLLLIS